MCYNLAWCMGWRGQRYIMAVVLISHALVQIVAQHQRKAINWELFRMHKENPPTDIGKQWV